MRGRAWVIGLVAVGIAIAVAIGIAGIAGKDQQTQTQAQESLCSSLSSLEGSVRGLTSLGTSSSLDDIQSAVSAIRSNWDQVVADAREVGSGVASDLDDAWTTFTQSLARLPSAGSLDEAVAAVAQSAQQLVQTADSTVASLGCT
jgi:hypothetical protein